MSFDNIKQLARGTDYITIEGVKEEVHLLTVSEREKYTSLANEGIGTIQANLGRGQTQKTNMNINKLTEATNKAEHYLIKCSFKTEEKEITEEDINGLYNIYPVLVKELKRVNGIIETDDETVIETLQNQTEQKIKK